MPTFAHRRILKSTWLAGMQASQAVHVEAACATAPVRSRDSYEPAPVLSGTDPVRTRDYRLIAFGGTRPFIGTFIVRELLVSGGLAFAMYVDTIETAPTGVHNHLV